MKSLNQLRRVRLWLIAARRWWVSRGGRVDIHPTSTISLSSRLLSESRGGISIGPETLVAFKTLLYSRDPATGADRPIVIGRRCFIGGGATITPGVTIGDETIVGAGAVVLDNVPARCIVGGNPARILRTDIVVGPFGRLAGADENTRKMWRI